MLSTALQAWMTVPWSRPPNASPISWRECLVSVRARYIAAWRGIAMLFGLRLLVMSLWRIWKWSATRFWIVSIVRMLCACSTSMSCSSLSVVARSSGLLLRAL